MKHYVYYGGPMKGKSRRKIVKILALAMGAGPYRATKKGRRKGEGVG